MTILKQNKHPSFPSGLQMGTWHLVSISECTIASLACITQITQPPSGSEPCGTACASGGYRASATQPCQPTGYGRACLRAARGQQPGCRCSSPMAGSWASFPIPPPWFGVVRDPQGPSTTARRMGRDGHTRVSHVPMASLWAYRGVLLSPGLEPFPTRLPPHMPMSAYPWASSWPCPRVAGAQTTATCLLVRTFPGCAPVQHSLVADVVESHC